MRSGRKVNKKALALFVGLVIVTVGLAWYFYRRKKEQAAAGATETATSSSSSTTYTPASSPGGSSPSYTPTPTPPPPPTDPYQGRRLLATQDGVKVYNTDFKTVYKTVNKGGWVGIVADSTAPSWYKITTTSGTAYVLKSQVKLG